jgi:septal ring factor EnvC (AmiA/AmiB activator)
MTASRIILAVLGIVGGGALALTLGGLTAQVPDAFEDPQQLQAAIAAAKSEAAGAAGRGEQLEAAARAATEAADKTAREAAALAARIQQSEAEIAAAEGRLALINSQRRVLMKRLAQRREPLVRLTGALQNFARRPLALSVLKPGSLQETVYLRAMLETTMPQVRQRTAALRTEVDRGRKLEAAAVQALAALESQQDTLDTRRDRLAAVETRQRLESRRRSGEAARETDRALALAEEARDLGGLVDRLAQAGSLRDELAALPGPILRPAMPASSTVAAVIPRRAGIGSPPDGLQLPVAGRTIAGFGSLTENGVPAEGVTIAPRGGAQVVAPAAGRVAFAGPYRGFGRIIIIEHGGGWTSLVTGLARTDVEVGEEIVAGAPLGVAGPSRPQVTLELRKDGQPVNPLDFIG